MTLNPLSSTEASLSGKLVYVTVQTGAPTSYETPLVYDNTPATGGLYGWNGSAYEKIGGLAS